MREVFREITKNFFIIIFLVFALFAILDFIKAIFRKVLVLEAGNF